MRELQNGIGFAFRRSRAPSTRWLRASRPVAGAIGEIDRLRGDNAALKADNDRLTAENARLEEIRRQNEQLTALLGLRAGMDFKTDRRDRDRPRIAEFRALDRPRPGRLMASRSAT